MDISTASGLALALGVHHGRINLSDLKHPSGPRLISLDGIAGLSDSSMLGFASNRGFSNIQTENALHSARQVGDSFWDPPDMLVPGNLTRIYQTDEIEETKMVPDYLDLSEVNAELNATSNTVFIGQKLLGLIPNQTKNGLPLQYWNFIDVDNNTDTGASAEELNKIGAPFTEFNGSEIITKALVHQPSKITGYGWEYKDGIFISLPQNATVHELYRHIIFPVYGPEVPTNITTTNTARTANNTISYDGIPMNDMIGVTVDNRLLNLTKDRPFNINALVTTDNDNISSSAISIPADIFDSKGVKGGSGFIFRQLNLTGHEPELEPQVIMQK